MKGFLAGIGCFAVVVALIAGSIGAVALGWGVSWVTAPFRRTVVSNAMAGDTVEVWDDLRLYDLQHQEEELS